MHQKRKTADTYGGVTRGDYRGSCPQAIVYPVQSAKSLNHAPPALPGLAAWFHFGCLLALVKEEN